MSPAKIVGVPCSVGSFCQKTGADEAAVATLLAQGPPGFRSETGVLDAPAASYLAKQLGLTIEITHRT